MNNFLAKQEFHESQILPGIGMSRLEIFIKSLLHSKNCKIEEEGGTCDKVNCVRYKYSLEHFNSCERRLINKCSFCQEYTRLFRNHSKTCQQSDCSVPLCNDFKNDFKNELIKLAKQWIG